MSIPHSHLERSAGRFASQLAAKTTRRSFFGRLGEGAVLAVGGSALAAASAAGQSPAQQATTPTVVVDTSTFTDAQRGATVPIAASSIPSCGCSSSCIGSCCNQLTVPCVQMPGWGQNSCPSGACDCGSWVSAIGTGACSSGLAQWYDCCGGCNNGASCTCYNIGGTLRPSCCTTKCYSGGCGNCAGGSYIKCRRYRCV